MPTVGLSDGLAEACRELGHTVKRRPPKHGDEDRFDVIFVGIAGFETTAAYYLADVIELLARRDAGLLFFLEDWRVDHVQWGISAADRHPDSWRRRLSDFMAKRDERLADRKFQDRSIEVIKRRLVPPWRALTPLYPWGDRSRLKCWYVKEWVPMDYTSTVPLPKARSVKKHRVWLSASKSPAQTRDFLEKLSLGWRVIYLGTTRGLDVRNEDVGKPRPEIEVADAMQEVWGVLSFPHDRHAGCGWCRNRFAQAAHTRCIVLCDEREAEPMGKAYRYVASRYPEVERMTGTELRRLADQQAEWFWARAWDRKMFLNAVGREVRHATSENTLIASRRGS